MTKPTKEEKTKLSVEIWTLISLWTAIGIDVVRSFFHFGGGPK